MTLTDWVAEKYAGQFIPMSGEPYFNHCLAVAQAAAPYTRFGYEAGLCHDLLEDQLATTEELQNALLQFGYGEAQSIVGIVQELTDVYIPEHYPGVGKKELRRLENQRLATASADAQTIKYADLIHNAAWVRRYQPHKWPRYARRKRKLLQMLDKGDPLLRQQALGILSHD